MVYRICWHQLGASLYICYSSPVFGLARSNSFGTCIILLQCWLIALLIAAVSTQRSKLLNVAVANQLESWARLVQVIMHPREGRHQASVSRKVPPSCEQNRSPWAGMNFFLCNCCWYVEVLLKAHRDKIATDYGGPMHNMLAMSSVRTKRWGISNW